MTRNHFISGLVVVSMLGLTLTSPIIANAATVAAQQPTDDQLKDRIVFRIDTDNLIRKYDIKVKVTGGVVTLSGDVATAAQKAQAGRVAKVAGVTRVDNTIVVDPTEDKSIGDKRVSHARGATSTTAVSGSVQAAPGRSNREATSTEYEPAERFSTRKSGVACGSDQVSLISRMRVR